ncbi:MAG TPA: hypothetical protein VJY39_16135 [Acidisphaera sp.]|nr:hypothetical protein [Acidisphaera sp.]
MKTSPDIAALDEFVRLIGARLWKQRVDAIKREAQCGRRAGKAVLQRFAVPLAIERLRSRINREPTVAECRVAAVAAHAVRVARGMDASVRSRLVERLQTEVAEGGALVPTFHLMRTAMTQTARGFAVAFAGLENDAPFDLLIARDGAEAEVACDVFSAEEGRGVHRGAWFQLADSVDPDLETWLSAHPGRYLLKLTLPQGLQDADRQSVASLHRRIREMLATQRRSDQDEAVVLRLDPLMLAAAQADELGLMSSLRREFGPEAHLSVTAAGKAVFVMAARAGRENEVAAAVRRRLCAIAPARLTGTRPGILALFIEDTDRTEWRLLRERLELEGETRQFLTCPEARAVIAVTCASRLELFGFAEPDGVADGELRFRNPAHPAAKAPGLAPAVLSSM